MLLLGVHSTFRKTGKKITIIKFQKVELFSFFVIHLYIYTYMIERPLMQLATFVFNPSECPHLHAFLLCLVFGAMRRGLVTIHTHVLLELIAGSK